MKKQFFRVKQLADQTFSRSGKSENLTDELQAADRKVEQLRTALQALCKRLTPSGSVTQGQDPAAREKRLRKLPEFMLGLTMQDASNFEDETLLKYILQECAKTEISLANEIAEHELKVEQLVCMPLNLVSDQDLPAIMKSKKQLNRLMSEKDSASSRYQHLLRQGETNPTKVSGAREEWEEACARVESARDILAADMFALLAKETQLAHTLLQFVKLQRAYHESALHSLQEIVPDLERFLNDSSLKPVFGYPLEQHLRVTGRVIAFPVELCICALHELGLAEEGLFRIAGGSSKVRRMKLSLDAGVFSPPLQPEYRDVHVVASVLKCYLRELPEPLLTYRLYDTFLLAVTRQTAEQARLNAIWDAIHHLPETNFNNLRYIIKFLSALTQNQSTNKMTPSNLAIVIAPNLLWAPDETTFDMNITTSINCVVELLIKHADWFFSDDVNFFISFTKEDLLPDLCEYGFTPNFVQGTYAHTMAMSHDQSNGGYDSMTKSMNDYSNRGAPTSLQGKHSRSNSHDTSLILIDNEIKRAQSNSSLSDQSSPPQGSPKPILRRKNKPIAPVPPNFTPPDKKHKPPADTQKVAVEQQKLVESPKTKELSDSNMMKDKATNTKNDMERPNKPPRPVVSDSGKIISGVQTINRSTYKQNKMANKLDEAKSTSRESLNELRRQSLDYDREAKPEPENKDAVLVVKNITAQTGVVGRMKVLGENYQTNPSCGDNASANSRPKQIVQPPARPVASPRTIVPIAKPEPDLESPEIQLRNNGNSDKFVKPAIPERPPALRPQSFRNSVQRNSLIEVPTSNATGENAGPTVLERTHVYSVDKQHPTIIQVGSTPTKTVENCETKTEESQRAAIQRTHSTGSQNKSKDEKEGIDEQKSLSSLSRQLSQSEGSIIDVPPSPRPNPNRPPRPQVPAPPPPTTSRPKSQDNPESTKL